MPALLRLLLVAVCVLLTQQLAAHAGPHAEAELLKDLPLGDRRVAWQPKIGHVFACASAPVQRHGAHAPGPWIDQRNQRFNWTAKSVVDGAHRWPSQFTISVEEGFRVIRGNVLLSHSTGSFPMATNDDAYLTDRNPNAIRAQDFLLKLPLEPQQALEPSCLPVGAIGYLLTGAVLFSALDQAGLDALAHESQDACQGHPEGSGAYHYHSLSFCQAPLRASAGHSALMGYALDGFGIYGRYGEAGKLLRNADLDVCHGHAHALDDALARYHYHATFEYPYTLGCSRGTPARLQGAQPPHKPHAPPNLLLISLLSILSVVLIVMVARKVRNRR
jgi:hypothetical protein